VHLPSELRDTGCLDYFKDYQAGRYDEEGYAWFVLPVEDVYINDESGGLVIGSPGVDGIEFCFRPNHSGVWAFYPINGEWLHVADTMKEFESKWTANEILL